MKTMHVFLGAWLLCSSCATAATPASRPAPRPAPLASADMPAVFLTGDDGEYPPEQFVRGVGQGRTAEEAGVQATAHICGKIDAEISSVLVSVASEQVNTSTGEDPKSQAMSRIQEEVRRTTRCQPDGMIEVVKSRAGDGVVRVLAVLDRATATGRYAAQATRARQQLARARETQAKAIERADLREATRQTGTVKSAAVELARALTLQQAVSGKTLGADAWTDVIAAGQAESDLRAQLATVEVEVCVSVAADFVEGEPFAALLTDQVAERGPTVRLCGHPAVGAKAMRIEAKVRGSFLHEPNLAGVVLCQPTLDLVISQRGRVLTRASLGGESARAGGPDRESAVRSALAELAKESGAHLREVFGE